MSSPSDRRLLAIVGPTATGKSDLAMSIAGNLDAEIVSVDSAMVYRSMDIGTAKPTIADRTAIPHHMIDVAEPFQTYTVAQYQAMARDAIGDIHARGRIPLLVGGSGLYFRAIVDDLKFPGTDPDVRSALEEQAADVGADAMHELLKERDPSAAEKIEPANVRRVVRALEVIAITGRPFSSFRDVWDHPAPMYDITVAGLTLDRAVMDRTIDARIDSQMAAGWLDEVSALSEEGIRRSLTAPQALGYAQLLAYLDGRMSLEEAVDETKRRTRKFARRQLTWFKADPRVRWFEADPDGAGVFLTDIEGHVR